MPGEAVRHAPATGRLTESERRECADHDRARLPGTMPQPLSATWALLLQLSVAAACWRAAGCFLSPTSQRTHGGVPSRALCLDFDRELLQHLAPFNFTLHTRRPLAQLRVGYLLSCLRAPGSAMHCVWLRLR